MNSRSRSYLWIPFGKLEAPISFRFKGEWITKISDETHFGYNQIDLSSEIIPLDFIVAVRYNDYKFLKRKRAGLETYDPDAESIS